MAAPMEVDGLPGDYSPADLVGPAEHSAPHPDKATPRKQLVPRDPTVRRRTARLACDFCHKKKTKCDGSYPCSNCKKRHIDCLWAGGAPVNLIAGSYTPEYVKWLEEKVTSLSGSSKTIEEAKNRAPVPYDQIPSPAPATVATPTRTPPAAVPSRPWEVGSARFAVADEVAGVNQHTNNQEFYGSSSSVALLARVGRSPSGPGDDRSKSHDDEPDALLTSLHNPVFSRQQHHTASPRRDISTPGPASSFYPQCRVFIDGFFSTLHYIFPILDKALFVRRCESLWASDGSSSADKSSSFVALYFSVLSLGALTGPRIDEPIDERDNLAWSRKFFEKARAVCDNLGMVTDLEMVQCYFFLSKVTQNELNPHLTYMYVGLAVRTALAIGINRSPSPTSKKDIETIKAETRTWWGLYSLETELSFGMGRPDTLGADLYHNRPFPLTIHSRLTPVAAAGEQQHNYDHDLLEPPQCAILELMVSFSRIIRRIRLQLYVPESPATRDASVALQYAASIEQELDAWVANLPEPIRPQLRTGSGQDTSLRSAKEPQYAKRQKLVLGIRYHNLRILLFGSFLLSAANRGDSDADLDAPSQQCVHKCIDSARETIDIIYETYRHNDFFRTWFYNVTYTVFAASMILLYMAQSSASSTANNINDTDLNRLSRYVEMAVEILEVMDESVIAVKSAAMIRRALDRLSRVQAAAAPPPSVPPIVAPGGQDVETEMWLPAHHYWGPVNLLDGGIDESFPFQLESWS